MCRGGVSLQGKANDFFIKPAAIARSCFHVAHQDAVPGRSTRGEALCGDLVGDRGRSRLADLVHRRRIGAFRASRYAIERSLKVAIAGRGFCCSGPTADGSACGWPHRLLQAGRAAPPRLAHFPRSAQHPVTSPCSLSAASQCRAVLVDWPRPAPSWQHGMASSPSRVILPSLQARQDRAGRAAPQMNVSERLLSGRARSGASRRSAPHLRPRRLVGPDSDCPCAGLDDHTTFHHPPPATQKWDRQPSGPIHCSSRFYAEML